MSEDTSAATAAAFEVLSSEPRVAILTALVAARRDGEESLSFSGLRERVGMRDSGQFNYHLDKLRGTFVERTDEGYELSVAGQEVVGAILAGTYTETAEKGPHHLEESCALCGTELIATYEGGMVVVECADGHQLFSAPFPPGAADDMDVPTLLEVASTRVDNHLALAVLGRCGICYGPVESEAGTESFDNGELHLITSRCRRCGQSFRASAGAYAVHDSEVVAFYREHGRDVGGAVPGSAADVISERVPSTVLSEDPFRIEFEIELDGDALRVVVDEGGRVVETERDYSATED